MPNLSDLLERSDKDPKSGKSSGSGKSTKPKTGTSSQAAKSGNKGSGSQGSGSLGDLLQPTSNNEQSWQEQMQRAREESLAYAEQRYKERAAAREAGAAAQQTAQTPGFLAPKNSFTMPGAAAATLGFQQQTQNKMPYQTRSFLDRDSVVQGKVYEGAAAGMQQAEAEGDIYGYIQHLDAAQKAYGNLAQNQEDEWKKKDPVEYYAYTMSEESLGRNVYQAGAEIERLKKETEEAAREQARLEGQYGTEYYDPDEIERLIRLQYSNGKRIETLNEDIGNYQAAKNLKSSIKDYQTYIGQAKESEDFQESVEEGEIQFQRYAASQDVEIKAKEEAKQKEWDSKSGWEKLFDKLGEYGYRSVDTTLPSSTMEASIVGMRLGDKVPEISEIRNRLGELEPDQLDLFYYWWNKDPEKALNYLDYAKQQGIQKTKDSLMEFGKEHPFLGTIAAAGANVISGADFLAVLAEKTATGEIGEHQPDMYISQARDLMHEGVSSNLDSDVQKFLYQVGTSMIDSGISMATGNTVPQFFLSAASSAYLETKDRGASDEQALAYGFLAGMAECIFEEVSVEKLLSQDTSRAIRAFLKQSFTEASEEIATSLANSVNDLLLSQAYDFETKVEARARELMERGVSEEDAKKEARTEWICEVLQEGLAGAISGGGMTAIHIGGARINRAATLTKIEQAGIENAGNMTAEEISREIQYIQTAAEQSSRYGNNEYAEQLLRYAKGLRQGQQNAEAVSTTAENNVEVPGVDWDDGSRDLPQRATPNAETDTATQQKPAPAGESGTGGQIQAIYEQTKQQFAEQARKLDDTTLQAMAENVERNLEDTRTEAAPAELATMEGQLAGLRQEISAREAVNRNGERMEAAARATEVPGVDWNDGSRYEEVGRQMTVPTETGGTDSSTPLRSDQNDNRADVGIGPYEGNGGQIAGTSEQEGLSYGTASQNTAAESPADSGQRDAGLGAGGQTGSLGESAGGPVSRSTRAQEINELKNYVKTLGTDRASARDLGIRNGSRNASNVLIDVEALTGSLKDRLTAMRTKAEEAGVRLDFVTGKMELRVNGQTAKNNGVFQIDSDGTPHLFVQADSRQFTPEQIYEHEVFHALVAGNKALWQDILQHLKETHTPEEIRSMVEAYASAYDGCYGYEDGAEDLYLEELMADVYAEMQRGGGQQSTARELAGETAQRFAGDIENARQNRAGIDRTNGPGTRFSIEADTELEEKNITDGNAAVKSLIEQAKTSNNPESLVIENAMYRSDIGYIDLKWGTPGRGDKFKHGYGLAHIIAKRNAEGGNGEAVAYKLIEVIAKATDGDQQTNDQSSPGNERIRLYYDGYTAVLVKSQDANKWLLTGWQNNETAASAVGEVRDSSNATAVTPIRTRRNGDAAVSIHSIAQDSENDKGSGKNNSDVSNNEIDWIGSREALQQNEGSYRWSNLRSRVSELSESQRRSLVQEAADLNEATWREEGLGIKPYSGSLADAAAVARYVDAAVDAVKSENGSFDYDPSFDLEATPRNEGSDLRFSAADEEDDGVDWLDGSELEETRKTDSSTALRSAQNDKTEEDAKTDVPSSVTAETVTPSPQGEGFEAQARDKKVEMAEKLGVDGLKSRIKSAEERLKMWRAMQSSGLVAKDANSVQELKNRIADTQETLNIFREELAKKQDAKKAAAADKELRAARKAERAAERKAAAKAAELADNTPRQARREFREDALNLFSVQAGKRQTLGNIINSFADKMIAQGSVSETDRAELFRQLYEAGVEVVPADEYHQNIRESVDSARIYVPDSVRAEFGDDWNEFRQRAWGNGVYLTNSQSDRGADSWNAELAEMFPGSFDAGETDARNMLENIVDLAEEGKAEFVSLPEMMRRNQAETGVTVDQQMDELERKVDHMIDTFAQKADLEIRTKKQGMMQLVRERQRNREMAARQVQRQRESNTRNEVMKQLQQLNRMRKRSAPEIQKQIDSIIGNLDTMARSISPEGMENLQALARKYSEAAQDPNFLGNPYVEARLARLSQTQLDSLEISDVIELGRTISALVKTVTEDKRLLTDERGKEIDQAAREVNKEIASSAGSKGGRLREFLGNEHLSPTRELQRLGGWVRGGMMEQLSRSLEDGGTRRMEYQRQATRIFDKFLEDKANQKWLQKAQGEDAEWIKVTVPAGITGENGSLKVQNVTFELTPMMRVGLLMHSRNVDNLRHIETGGIVIPNKEFYRKGDLANADAAGTRVKLRPEVVRAIVKDCTAQELAFASLLEQYYDGFSKEKINEVSMLIDGFERAGGNHYYGIKVSRKFLAALPEQIQKNMSLESIGSIVNERVHAGNPIILEDASTALKDHIDLISKYYGFTAPIRDFNAVMNYTFHTGMNEQGAVNAYAGSVKETLQDKWKAGAQEYINELLADLQQSSNLNDTTSRILSALRGNLAGASLMFNPAVAISQTASLPGAIQVVGLDGMVAGLKPEKVDMGLIEKYTPILWYRNQGNSTQELGDYMAKQGLEGKLPFFFNWIQKMDSWTIRRLWAASEYRVSKDTDLAPGSKAQIDAGEDAYYQEVARVFQRAVYDTQPNYSEMQRPAILRSKKDLTKFLTMYKTVPLQYYNMMYEAVGRLKADKARFDADGSAANKAQFEQSRSFAARTFVGVLGANVVYVVMKAAVKGLLGGKDDRFKDEEGEFDWGKTLSGLGKDLVETYAGSVIFGNELLGFIEKQIEGGNYYNRGVFEISALSALNQTIAKIQDLRNKIVDQDLTGGLGAIKDLAKQIAMDTGIPANNIETYLLGTAKWFAPEWVDRYENFFDEFERADLKGEHGRDLRAAIRVLMDNRTDGLKDETIDELMRLWETGQNAVIPSAIPSKVTVDGEDVEIKGSDKAAFRERWGQVIDDSLEKLLASDAYQGSDDAGKAKLISKLYEFARQQAAAAVTDKKVDAWVEFGQACEAAGIPLDQYLSVASVDKSKLKDMDGEALDNAIQARMEFRVGELDEKTLDELARLYAAGATAAIPSDVPTSVSVSGEENKLTAEERVAWLQAWKRTAGENLESLMASKAYQQADDTGKAKLISALYDLARASASSEVVSGYDPDKWITVGMEAKERGVPLDEYAAFHVGLSGLKTAEKMDLLKSQSWSEDQKEFLWSKLMASKGKWVECGERLTAAGVRIDDYIVYYEGTSDAKNRDKYAALAATSWTDSQKLIALEYISSSTCSAARVGKSYQLSMNLYLEGLAKADSDQSGNISQAEAEAYLDGLGSRVGWEEKAYLWQMLSIQSKWKNNPYSATYGEEIWHDLHPDG